VVMGGTPVVIEHPLDVVKVMGVEFPAGVPVKVDDHSLALKLRCMGIFDEVSDSDALTTKNKTDQEEAHGDVFQQHQEPAPAPKKRGRPAKLIF
jgi:hypothetical protein